MKRTIGRRFFGAALGGCLALLFAAAAGNPAQANKCNYGTNANPNNGPCVNVKNELEYDAAKPWASREMNLWCLEGPTSSDRKIILQPGNNFTCKGHRVKIQRAQAGCNPPCEFTSACNGKSVRTLNPDPDWEDNAWNKANKVTEFFDVSCR